MILSYSPLNWHPSASRSQKVALNAGQERPFKVGGDVDKNPCFLPLWWAKLVFLLLLCTLKDVCEGNLGQF